MGCRVGTTPSSLRAAATGTLGSALALAATAVLARVALRSAAELSAATVEGVAVEAAVTTVTAVLATLLSGWLAAVLLLGALLALPGRRSWGRAARRAAEGLAPRWAPRTTALLLAVSVPAPVASATHGPPAVTMAGPVVARALEPVPEPGWSDTGSTTTPRPAECADDQHPTVTVRPGDTLWGLAVEALGPGASASDVAREWPRWYAGNVEVVGADPDLIRPGQQLRVPDAEGGRP